MFPMIWENEERAGRVLAVLSFHPILSPDLGIHASYERFLDFGKPLLDLFVRKCGFLVFNGKSKSQTHFAFSYVLGILVKIKSLHIGEKPTGCFNNHIADLVIECLFIYNNSQVPYHSRKPIEFFV